jgi:hypothetical protein
VWLGVVAGWLLSVPIFWRAMSPRARPHPCVRWALLLMAFVAAML